MNDELYLYPPFRMIAKRLMICFERLCDQRKLVHRLEARRYKGKERQRGWESNEWRGKEKLATKV